MRRADSAGLTALGAAALLRAGDLSTEEYADELCWRVRERNAEIDAWAFFDELMFRGAMRSPGEGPLCGLPVAVKDIIDTFDMPTECGSPLYKGRRPLHDAAVVVAIRRAGGVVLGKTVTTEFAYAHPGATRNPHDPAHTPGGSSSGSAAAVAAGMAPLAIGTQTAGSIVRPAAFCGVIGFKPTFGRISRVGVQPFSESLDTVGAFARTVADAWLLVEVMSGERATVPLQAVERPPRIGLCRTSDWERAAPETRAAVEDTVAELARSGATVRDVAVPEVGHSLQEVHLDIMRRESAQTFAHHRRVSPDRLSPVLLALIEEGDAITPNLYRRRLAQAEKARWAMMDVFADLDLILSPSAVGEAPQGLGNTGDAIFNRVWTMLRGPAIHLPTGRGPKGLPVGVQLLAAPWRDAELAATAFWAERAVTT